MSIYMDKAVALAQIAEGQTECNPPVGAVIVKDGVVIGTGSHLQMGTDHAEVQAIKSCIQNPEGADIHVTLEPCSHHGRTPPCTDAIRKAGIKRVFYAVKDKNPKVSGYEVLEMNGIHAEHQPHEEAAELYEAFFTHSSKKRPVVTLKSAMSLDGKMALEDGSSKWITNESARQDVQYLRHTHDAILVGGGTLMRDNPRLTSRIEGGGNHPRPVVLLGTRKLERGLNIENHPKKPIIFTSNKGNSDFNQLYDIVYGEFPNDDILKKLYRDHDISSVLVEGGSRIHTVFINEALYDQIIIYIAPKLFGKSQHEMFQSELSSMEETVQLELTDVEKLQSDLKLTYRRN